MPLTDQDADFYKVTLKSWLYEKIKLNKQHSYTVYPGLEWLDEDRRCFKLPWVTESHPEWEQYYKLFHEWASREGKPSTDSQKAKRNFRSALNHSKHFEHIAFMDQERQTGSYKVYKFRTQEEIMKAKSRNTSEDSSVSQQTPEAQYHVATPSNGLMEVGPNAGQAALCEGQEFCNNLNLDLNNPQQQQWLQPSVQMPMNIMEQDISEGDLEMASITIPSVDSGKQNVYLDSYTKGEKTKCLITVEYNGRKVDEKEVTLAQASSCLIIYGDGDHLQTVQALNLHRANPLPLFPKEFVMLKPPATKAPGLTKILEHMNTGIHIWYDESSTSFYLLRECLAHVYCFNMHEDTSGNESREKALQIGRKRQYLMLSYDQLFHDVILNDVDPSAPKPSDTVEIIAGIQPKPGDRGRGVKGVKISVQFLGANNVLNSEDILQELKVSTDISSLDELIAFKEQNQQMVAGAEPMQT